MPHQNQRQGKTRKQVSNRPDKMGILVRHFPFSDNRDRLNIFAQPSRTAMSRSSKREILPVGKNQGLLELARITEQIQEQYPQQADELVRPLIGQMVKHDGPDTSRSLDRLMVVIDRNKWFWYGKLLVEEARSQSLLEEDVADALGARLEAARLARELTPSDPCEPTVTVKQYLAQLDADPPAGTLTRDDVREILENGLAKPCADANLELKHELVENVVCSIRLIAGDGPFRGDRAKLIESIERFSGLYLVDGRVKEPIDTVLATFLALSFCDISTPEDHDVLFSQIRKLCKEFQTLTNIMFSERGLSTLVAPNDVERVFSIYEKKFRRYIDDPLWPAFKFPLTANEQLAQNTVTTKVRATTVTLPHPANFALHKLLVLTRRPAQEKRMKDR